MALLCDFMSLMQKGVARVVLVIAALAAAGGVMAACSGATADPVLAADAGTLSDAASTTEGGPFTDAARPDAADAAAEAEGPKGNCTIDADCKDGTCFEHLCMCNAGSYVQLDGTCGSSLPPASCPLAAGKCISGADTCPSGEPTGTPMQNRTCGDFQAGLCCFATCGGTPDFSCCATGDPTPAPSICVNTWLTCGDARRPVSNTNPKGCAL